MVVSIFVAEFLLLLNTGPLNAAVINSVGAHIRAAALAVNILVLHLLGDVPSASLIGYMSDRYSQQSAFIAPVVAIAPSSAILFYGMNFAPGEASTKIIRSHLKVAMRSIDAAQHYLIIQNQLADRFRDLNLHRITFIYISSTVPSPHKPAGTQLILLTTSGCCTSRANTANWSRMCIVVLPLSALALSRICIRLLKRPSASALIETSKRD